MKKLLGIVVLLTFFITVGKADNLIHISCVDTSKKMFDKNLKEDKLDLNQTKTIRTFDLKKELLADTNFKKNKPVAAIIDDDTIYWHIIALLNDKKQKDYQIWFETQISVLVSVFEINRFSGTITQNMYGLDRATFIAYGGGYVENGEIKESPFKYNTKPWLENAKKIIETSLLSRKNKIPQKEIIHMTSGSGECEKVSKAKKF